MAKDLALNSHLNVKSVAPSLIHSHLHEKMKTGQLIMMIVVQHIQSDTEYCLSKLVMNVKLTDKRRSN